MNAINREIVQEIAVAMEKLEAKSDLLGIVGSWGDSLTEPQVLSMLKGWNGTRERTERYGMTSHRPAYSQA